MIDWKNRTFDWIIITHDPANVYSEGEWVNKKELIDSYCATVDAEHAAWIRGEEINLAVKNIALYWNLEYVKTISEEIYDGIKRLFEKERPTYLDMYSMLTSIIQYWDEINKEG